MTRLPASIRESVELHASAAGLGSHIESVQPVAGGCINHGCRVLLDGDSSLFVKWNPRAPAGMFESEADGLRALRGAAVDTGAELAVPTALAHGRTAEGGWLALEYLPPGRSAPSTDVLLGRALALLHGAAPESTFGWHRDNWIGTLPQSNTPHPDWATFWRDRRIRPQLDAVRQRDLCTDPVFDRVSLAIPNMERPACLLHGDLWSGNAFVTSGGTPALIDPAVYRGDGEVDLAMTQLFGGFGSGFYDAYAEVRGIDPGYHAFRRDLYQLYYLLVHVSLFGHSYEAQARAAAGRVAATLS
jgi:fructosamine-3-kinase